MNIKKMRFLILVFFCIICSCKKEAVKTDNAINVEVSKPKNMVFKDILSMRGNIEPEEHINICARVAGNIDILKVDEGDKVKKGELLFQIDKKNLESQLKIAESHVEIAQKMCEVEKLNYEVDKFNLQNAEYDLIRAKKLIKSNNVSRKEYEDIILAYKTAKANLKSGEADLKQKESIVKMVQNRLDIARKQLSDSKAKSLYNGVVTIKYKEKGEYVQPGVCVLQIENPNALEVSALLTSRYYSQVHPGITSVKIYSAEGKKIVDAIISYKSPCIDSTTRTFEVKVDLPSQKEIVSGMLCRLGIVLSERKGIGVPEDSVIVRSGGKTVIFVIENGKAKEVDVKTGLSYKGYTEILGGLNSSGLVVTKGQAFLNEGDKVVVKNEKQPEKLIKKEKRDTKKVFDKQKESKASKKLPE